VGKAVAPSSQFDVVFRRLREILSKHHGALNVSDDTSTKYCLEAAIGPATLQAWGGKAKRPRIPVAWVEVSKAYVSYHLMGVANPAVQSEMSKELKARMQGKTCFNFTSLDEAAIEEVDSITSSSIAAFKKAGFIA
jgi:hypothetical protein